MQGSFTSNVYSGVSCLVILSAEQRRAWLALTKVECNSGTGRVVRLAAVPRIISESQTDSIYFYCIRARFALKSSLDFHIDLIVFDFHTVLFQGLSCWRIDSLAGDQVKLRQV